ncbi:MAG: MFS transporter [Candidatus Eisenbacteria bacterium]
MPDLLRSKPGRLLAFFMLYMSEGIPLGFTATAVATQMRRQGVGPAEIGAFVGSLYLPWAFKWAAGPVVDSLTVSRFGRRRFWILLMQGLMILTLLAAMPIDFAKNLALFSAIIFVHNCFAATQDVAIDALAVNVLPEAERGVANGFMFAGAYMGMAVGGSGVLFLTPVIGFHNSFLVVAGCIALIMLLVTVPIREPVAPPRLAAAGSAIAAVAREIGAFLRDSMQAFLGSRPALVGVLFALLPGGAYALGLALQSNLAVELGLNDQQVATLNLSSSVISAGCCIAGGWLSDRFGRRGTLAWTMGATAIPTAALAWGMNHYGWVHPVAPGGIDRPVPAAALLQLFWASVLIYNVFQGLYYGIRTALFMDVTTPRVAATQFTAYMALMNLAISYSSLWQGRAVERWGYPVTLAIDSVVGLLCLACLPFMRPTGPSASASAGPAVPETIAP